MGSSEFLLAGVLPAVASGLHVDLATVGGLITAFAIGVVIGGPPFAVISRRWPRRTALVLTQLVFALCIAIGLLISTYEALLITRFLAGLAYAGFFAVAAVTAVSLVPADRAARASGVVVSGLSLAMILGGPAGTAFGYRTGWQSGFWLVVTLTVLAAITITLATPHRPQPTTKSPDTNLRRELRTLRQPRLWTVLAITLLTTASYMITFSYLSELLTRTTRIPTTWTAPVLVLFGLGAYLGLAIGGRIADRRPHLALTTGTIGILTTSALIATLAHHASAVIPLVFLLGVAGFILNPAIYGRIFTLAPTAPTLAGATTVSAFQLGISFVPALAALPLHLGAPLPTIPCLGTLLATLTLPLILRDHTTKHR
ncbi:MFS transporter [Kribbella hippodromi]